MKLGIAPSCAVLVRGSVLLLLATLLLASSWHSFRPVRPAVSVAKPQPQEPQQERDTCGGDWGLLMSEYARFHDEAVANLSLGHLDTPKIVIWRGLDSEYSGGLGDRIVGIASTFLFCLKYRRLFFIHWPGVELIWEPVRFNWTLPSILQDNRNYTTYLSTNCEGRQAKGPCWWHLADPDKHFNASISVWRCNRGFLMHPRKEHSNWFDQLIPGVRQIGCVYQAIFTASKHVLQYTAPYVRRMATQVLQLIGLHIRAGDSALIKGYRGNVNPRIVDCVGRLSRGLQKPVLFVAADDVRIRTMFENVQHWNGSVTAIGLPPRHINKGDYKMWGAKNPSENDTREALIAAMTDWWILSMSHVLMMAAQSGFSATAGVYSRTTIVMFADRCTTVVERELGTWRQGL